MLKKIAGIVAGVIAGIVLAAGSAGAEPASTANDQVVAAPNLFDYHNITSQPRIMRFIFDYH